MRTHCKAGHALEGPNVARRRLKGRWFRTVCLCCERVTRARAKRARIIRRLHERSAA